MAPAGDGVRAAHHIPLCAGAGVGRFADGAGGGLALARSLYWSPVGSVRISVGIAVFFAGAVLMALEILAFRIIGKTFGSALRETSVVISVFLAAMSLGYYFGGRFADRWPRLRTFLAALFVASATMALVPFLDETLSERVFASGIPFSLHAAVVTIVLFFVPTMFLASASPIAIRLSVRGVDRSGSAAGTISAISTFGSIVGSVGAAFVLVDYFESVHRTIWALALLTLGLVLMTMVAFSSEGGQLGRLRERNRFAYGSGLAIGGLLLVALLSMWLAQPVGLTAIRGGMEYGTETVFEQDSTFHHIRVGDHNRLRTLYFDRTMQSQMSLEDPNEGAFPYVDLFHLSMALNPETRRVLFIGLGGGSAPRQFLHDYPGVTIDAVDVDPAVIDVAKDWFHVREGPRLRLHAADGRVFLRRTSEVYDLIAIDAYTTNRYGATIPAHLTTREFFREAAAKLSPRGIIAYNVAASPDASITRSLSKTLFRALPYQIALRAQFNTVILGSRDDIRLSGEALRARVRAQRERGLIRRSDLEGLAGKGPAEMKLVGIPILTDDYAPVDRLMRGE
jgi:spermidine synthase